MHKLALLPLILILSACAVGPDYKRPQMNIGVEYKASEDYAENTGWVPASPNDDELRSDWWVWFSDPRLNGLMQTMLESNFELEKAQAQYRQAQASLKAAHSGFFPGVGLNASSTSSGSGSGSEVQTQYSGGATVSWEPDLWGRIRRTTEGASAGAAATRADLELTRLSLQSTLAQTYFQWLGVNSEIDLMQKTVEAYEQGLKTTQNRLNVGVATPADVASATMQLESARGQLQSLSWQRSQLENALAALQGKVPSDFILQAGDLNSVSAPRVPVGLPSELLQRRPDVAAAERRMQQANASIGVAKAAWFPDLTLSAQGGYRSGSWSSWLTAPARFWSLGPALALTIFDGGLRSARVDEALANYDVQAAAYKQTVIDALKEVEDLLVELSSLDKEISIHNRTLQASTESLNMVRNQYNAGMVDYLSVIQVETSHLNAQRTAISLQTNKLNLVVKLITALGGGWDQKNNK